LLDIHSDDDHNRCVLTLGGPHLDDDLRRIASAVVAGVDLRPHSGAHPRLGSLDVVPFVSLRLDHEQRICDGPIEEAVRARDRFMAWATETLGLPCFAYGPERSLPEVRRRAFGELEPDAGPSTPHPSAGACAVGARPLLVAYNLWLAGPDLELARSIAGKIRGSGLRALGLAVGARVQVSCNLIDPFHVGPAEVHDEVLRLARASGSTVERAELVGLAPLGVLERIPEKRWVELDLGPERTIEARLERQLPVSSPT
jgi:glutamate formiminotransferase / 5-formyltetrahydrofolate cyclo-ligase